MASIGQTPNEQRRATRKEAPFEGLTRRDLQDRFSSIDSTPTEGPTVPSDEAPQIMAEPSTTPQRDRESRNLQDTDQDEEDTDQNLPEGFYSRKDVQKIIDDKQTEDQDQEQTEDRAKRRQGSRGWGKE